MGGGRERYYLAKLRRVLAHRAVNALELILDTLKLELDGRLHTNISQPPITSIVKSRLTRSSRAICNALSSLESSDNLASSSARGLSFCNARRSDSSLSRTRLRPAKRIEHEHTGPDATRGKWKKKRTFNILLIPLPSSLICRASTSNKTGLMYNGTLERHSFNFLAFLVTDVSRDVHRVADEG